MGGVFTGRSTPPMQTTVNLPDSPDIPGSGGPTQITVPGQPIMRMSFLQSFLANLGPALSAGLAPSPGHPFGSGLGAALGGIEEQRRYNQTFGMQQQQTQSALASQATTRAYQQAETAKIQQLTPYEVQQAQLNNDMLAATTKFWTNPGNLDDAIQQATKSFTAMTPDEQAQIDAAKQQAQRDRKFDPINVAVRNISQDRLEEQRQGKSPEKQALQAYLTNPKLDPGVQKDAATFVAWKAKQQPAAMVIGNQLPQDALAQQAERYSQTGELPGELTRSPGTIAAIISLAAKLHPNQDLASNKATFAANKASLTKLQSNLDAVSAFENTAIRNLDQVVKTGAQIPDLGARFANVPVRAISGDILGTPQMAAFRTALLTAQTESAKVLNSANLSGVLSDEARKEAAKVLNGDLPFPAMLASINQLKTDFGNRHQSYAMQIADIQGRLHGAGNNAAPTQTPAGPSKFDPSKLPDWK